VVTNEPPGGASHVPALDGIRGLAILLVILFHHTLMQQPTLLDRIYVNVARLGWSGVDLFFVLSGFLITGILCDSRGSPHYFRNFYARRTLRIFPVYYAFVLFTLRIAPWLWPDTSLARMARAAMRDTSEAWYWLYLSNILFAIEDGFGHPNLAVTWSLAIEEQFYLVWPLVVAVLGLRPLMWTCLALVAVAFVARTALLALGINETAPYVLPFCRMDALAVGALVALALRTDQGRARVMAVARYALPAMLVVILGIWYAEGPLDNQSWGEPVMQGAGFTAVALFFGSLLALTVTGAPDSRLSRFLSLRPLRTFGKYSYALYLFHVPVRRFIRDTYFPVAAFPTWLGSPLPGQLLFYVVATAPAFALAWLSWHLYEKQFLRMKAFFPYGRRTLPATSELPREVSARAEGSGSAGSGQITRDR
jgi:peptidoglycan/LPS O-acetylase OafA/YrhL